jgi:hypothetical protein
MPNIQQLKTNQAGHCVTTDQKKLEVFEMAIDFLSNDENNQQEQKEPTKRKGD